MADAQGDIPDPAPFVEEHGLLSWLGVTVESWDRGEAVLRLPATDEVRNHGQADPAPIHGGAIATVIDTASTAALSTTIAEDEEAWMTTTNLDVSYLKPAVDDLLIVADVVRAGGSMGVTDVTAAPEDGDDSSEPVAVGRAHFRLFRGTD